MVFILPRGLNLEFFSFIGAQLVAFEERGLVGIFLRKGSFLVTLEGSGLIKKKILNTQQTMKRLKLTNDHILMVIN